MTAARDLLIVGPNLPGAESGMHHVHAASCSDLNNTRRYPKRLMASHEAWRMTAATVEDVVTAIYSDIMAENEGAYAEWTAYENEVKVFPCARLARTAEATPAAAVCPHTNGALTPSECHSCHAAAKRKAKRAAAITTPAALGVVVPEPELSAAEVWLTHAANAAAEVARAKADLSAAVVSACQHGGASYRQVAEVTGLSHERVRQIVKLAQIRARA